MQLFMKQKKRNYPAEPRLQAIIADIQEADLQPVSILMEPES